MTSEKIGVNSADSLRVEPDDLFTTSLPAALVERKRRSVKDDHGKWETLHELFDDVGVVARERITIGALLDLFPYVGRPPEAHETSIR